MGGGEGGEGELKKFMFCQAICQNLKIREAIESRLFELGLVTSVTQRL